MRFVHLADLHLGKRLNGVSLLTDQAFALDAILDEIGRIAPDIALIAGDVYDKTVPSEEAVLLFDRFLTRLTERVRAVCVIGGNHDSQDRLSFASGILSRRGVHIAGAYDGRMRAVTVPDAHGEVTVWLLPHLRPREVARFFPGNVIESADGAVRAAIERESIDPARRNILVTHQFVAFGGETPLESESEINPVGGLHVVDAGAFAAFQYVALGHLHRPQRVGRDAVRYAGSPLKYSFSEVLHKKSFVSGEIDGNGAVSVETVPIPALHGMRALQGRLPDLLDPKNYTQGDVNDYLRVTLTDDPPPMSPMEQLGSVYPNVLRLDFAGQARDGEETESAAPRIAEKTRMELFADFYREMTGVPMDDTMAAYARDMMNETMKESE